MLRTSIGQVTPTSASRSMTSGEGVSPAGGGKVIRRSLNLSKAGSALFMPTTPTSGSGALPSRRSTIDVLPRRQRSISSSRPKGLAFADGEAQQITTPPQLPTPPSTTRGADTRSIMLAKKYRLEFWEVKRIIKAFELVAPSKGGMDLQDFQTMMCHVFDVPSVEGQILHSAYMETCFDKAPDVERFVEWYVQHMFTQVSTLKACPKQAYETNLTYSLAKQHECSVSVIDKIHHEFARFDTDGSGEIDYPEFSSMMAILMKVKATCDMSEQRLKKFWQEVDKTSHGTIHFSGFCAWYLKNFNTEDAEGQPTAGVGPAEALYASYHPIVARRNLLSSGSRRRSI